jgi:multiple sugar transport system substrate-binding protein
MGIVSTTGISRRRCLQAAGWSGLTAALAACGGAGGGAAPAQAPVSLQFVPISSQVDNHKTILEQFMAANPRIKVELAPVTGVYVDKITALQAADALPDTIYLADVHVKSFAYNKIAANMETLAVDKESQALLKDCYQVMLNLGRTRLMPGLFMLPWALDGPVLYYNKTLFQAAGVPLPTFTWTIDDLVNAAKQLTKVGDDPPSSQYGVTLSWTWWAEYVPWVRGFGGDVGTADGKKFTMDAPEAIAGIQAMTDLVTKYRVAPPPGTDFGGNPWLLGKVAMTVSNRNLSQTTRQKAATNFDWDAEVRPIFPKKRLSGIGTQGWAVSTQTKHPEEAWQVTKYHITPPAQRIFAQTYAAVPILQSMRTDPAWRDLAPPPANHDAFVKMADYGTLPPEFALECGSVYTGQINDIATSAITSILTGKAAAAAALRDATTQINACLATASR